MESHKVELEMGVKKGTTTPNRDEMIKVLRENLLDSNPKKKKLDSMSDAELAVGYKAVLAMLDMKAKKPAKKKRWKMPDLQAKPNQLWRERRHGKLTADLAIKAFGFNPELTLGLQIKPSNIFHFNPIIGDFIASKETTTKNPASESVLKETMLGLEETNIRNSIENAFTPLPIPL
eukprot:g3808.t1